MLDFGACVYSRRELPAQLEHAQNRNFRTFSQRFRQNDFRIHVQKRGMRFFQRIHFHETALTTEAILRRSRDEFLAGNFLMQAM